MCVLILLKEQCSADSTAPKKMASYSSQVKSLAADAARLWFLYGGERWERKSQLLNTLIMNIISYKLLLFTVFYMQFI